MSLQRNSKIRHVDIPLQAVGLALPLPCPPLETEQRICASCAFPDQSLEGEAQHSYRGGT